MSPFVTFQKCCVIYLQVLLLGFSNSFIMHYQNLSLYYSHCFFCSSIKQMNSGLFHYSTFTEFLLTIFVLWATNNSFCPVNTASKIIEIETVALNQIFIVCHVYYCVASGPLFPLSITGFVCVLSSSIVQMEAVGSSMTLVNYLTVHPATQ